MDDANSRSQWYRTEAYPLQAGDEARFPLPAPVSEPEREPIRSPGRPASKALGLAACIVLLIAATTYIFTDSARQAESYGAQSPHMWSEPSPRASEPPAEGWDYFGDYAIPPQRPANSGSLLERAPTGGDVSMELKAGSGEELTLKQIYERCGPTVVSVVADTGGIYGQYLGSGIIMTSDGYILTNAHVISGAVAVSVVTTENREYSALLVGEDTQTDIAVLKIDAENLPEAEFGRSDDLEVGDKVAAIGNPLGRELYGTMTDGIVSAINRGIEVNGHVMNLIQTNAAINEGNSGGPLINSEGRVIGVTNMKMVARYSSVTVEGIGFAIPTSSLKETVDELIKNGRVSGRPSIGITGRSNAGEIMGVWVEQVDENSDAAGKLFHGDVITAVNGIEVATVGDINAIKDGLAVGDTLTLTVFREGRSFDVEIELTELTSN